MIQLESDLLCSKCNKDARWNTPMIPVSIALGDFPEREKYVICCNCTRSLGDYNPFHPDFSHFRLYVGISQHSPYEVGWTVFQWGDMILHYDDDFCLWWNYGGRAYPLDARHRKQLELIKTNDRHDMVQYLTMFLSRIHRDIHIKRVCKCTSCSADLPLDDIGGYPLFAGVVCKTCWAKHQAKVTDQIARREVCSMCGQPYLNCCC